MPKFESEITNKSFSGPPMRNLSVPDDTGYQQPQQTFQQPRSGVREMPQQAPVFDQQAMRDFQNELNPQTPKGRELSEIEKNFIAAKKAKREGKEKLSDGARRRIELLLGMTRLTKDIEIVGQKYRVQTLTSQELRDAIVATAEFDGSVQSIFESRKQLMARSLTIVAGVEVEQFLNSNDFEDKLTFIEELDHQLLQRLFTEYNLLAKDAQDKYNPKTDTEVKEVMEDLKK